MYKQTELKIEHLTDRQQSKIERAFAYLSCGGSTPQNIKIINMEGIIFISFHIGDSIDCRWFDDTYHFRVGERGKLTMISGPKRFKHYKTWCGMHIKI